MGLTAEKMTEPRGRGKREEEKPPKKEPHFQVSMCPPKARVAASRAPPQHSSAVGEGLKKRLSVRSLVLALCGWIQSSHEQKGEKKTPNDFRWDGFLHFAITRGGIK
jgi:hypothetical protein